MVETDDKLEHHADASTFNPATPKPELYSSLLESAHALFDSRFYVSNLANAAALLWHAFEALDMHVNWSGFYVANRAGDELLLGPFMGKVACQRIQVGKGVCGTAASTKRTQVVADVDAFPGHIACDGGTKSEVVVPVVSGGVVRAVLDVDCLALDGFDADDVKMLESLAALIGESCDWP